MTTEAFDTFDDLDDMMSGGAPSAFKKKDPIGSIFEGKIVSIGKKQQQYEYDPKTGGKGKPKTYDDGNPMYQVPITIATTRRETDIPNDDGHRTLYMKGKLFAAIKAAVRAAGPDAKLRPGGYLWTQHYDTEPGDAGAKLFNARYTPPAPQAHTDIDTMFADNGPAVAAQAASVLNGNPHSTPPVAAPAPVVAQATNAATIAAKLAAATAVAPPPVENPLVAGLSADQKAAIRNLSTEQAAAAGLEQVWNALQ